MIARYMVLMCLMTLPLQACKNADTAPDNQVATTTETRVPAALQAHSAIDTGDLTALANLSAFPLHVRLQEWESLTGGFALGPSTDVIVEAKDELINLDLLQGIGIEAEVSDVNSISIADLEEELKGVSEHWNDLDITLYLRGFGDVEHIILFGVDPKTQKLRAIYFN